MPKSIELLERQLRERRLAGEISGRSIAATWRDLATACAAERQQLRAMAARRHAVGAYFAWADSEDWDLPSSASPGVEALKQARIEARYGVMSEPQLIELGVELAREDGLLAGDDAVVALACLDARVEEDRARATSALDRALQAHAPGWHLQKDGLEIVQLVLDLEVQRFVEDSGVAGLSEWEVGCLVRKLADVLDTMDDDLGWQAWLEYFRPDGASRKSLSIDEDDPQDVQWIREACSAYLTDRAASQDPRLAAEARDRMTERAKRRDASARASGGRNG